MINTIPKVNNQVDVPGLSLVIGRLWLVMGRFIDKCDHVNNQIVQSLNAPPHFAERWPEIRMQVAENWVSYCSKTV